MIEQSFGDSCILSDGVIRVPLTRVRNPMPAEICRSLAPCSTMFTRAFWKRSKGELALGWISVAMVPCGKDCNLSPNQAALSIGAHWQFLFTGSGVW